MKRIAYCVNLFIAFKVNPKQMERDWGEAFPSDTFLSHGFLPISKIRYVIR